MCPNCKKYTEVFYKKYNPIDEMALVYGVLNAIIIGKNKNKKKLNSIQFKLIYLLNYKK